MLHELFNTANYQSIEDEDVFYTDYVEFKNFFSLISKTKRGRKVKPLVCIGERSSHYGSICNDGKTGFLVVSSLDELLSKGGDEFKFMFNDEDNTYSFEFIDHDGKTKVTFAPISKTEMNDLDFDSMYFEKALGIIQNKVDNFQAKEMPTYRYRNQTNGEIIYSIF